MATSKAISKARNAFVEGQSMHIPFRSITRRSRARHLEIQGESYGLRKGEYTPGSGLLSWRHRCLGAWHARFLLTQTAPECDYVTPIQIDSESPALPISQPAYYAIYLRNCWACSRRCAAEDTWALNEGAINDDVFPRAGRMIKRARSHVLSARFARGAAWWPVAFDTTDRVRDMFYRYPTQAMAT
jgi:hypothetical protein